MEDGEELKAFLKIWFVAILSLCYCYLVSIRITKSFHRLLAILPIIALFFVLPLPLSTIHVAGPTIFYLVWLGNFKLILLALNRGPLASTPPLPFVVFLSIALLPINPKRANKISAPASAPISASAQVSAPASASAPVSSHKPMLLGLKALILALIVSAYQYKDNLHKNVILCFYCCHVYLGVELILAITAYFVKLFLGFGFMIEPQFNEPYLSTSLQDFWGRRWNLMVSSILRPTVYNPIREISFPILGQQGSQLPAIFATFLVSGLMHELIYLYLTRVRPTWEVTWFFVLHGVCTAVEVVVKKAVDGRFRLHRAVSGPLTVVFVAVTGVWLFLPQILRNGVDVKAIDEYSIMVKFLRSKLE